MKKASTGETAFALLARARGWEFIREYRFHPERRWRFDFAAPGEKVAVEIEGGVWSGGRHTRGSGFVGDLEKYNAAAVDGWCVLRFTTADVTRNPGAVSLMVSAVLTKGRTE